MRVKREKGSSLEVDVKGKDLHVSVRWKGEWMLEKGIIDKLSNAMVLFVQSITLPLFLVFMLEPG